MQAILALSHKGALNVAFTAPMRKVCHCSSLDRRPADLSKTQPSCSPASPTAILYNSGCYWYLVERDLSREFMYLSQGE